MVPIIRPMRALGLSAQNLGRLLHVSKLAGVLAGQMGCRTQLSGTHHHQMTEATQTYSHSWCLETLLGQATLSKALALSFSCSGLMPQQRA